MAVFVIHTTGRRSDGRTISFPFECAHDTVPDVLMWLDRNGYVFGAKLICAPFDKDGPPERMVKARVEAAVFKAGLEMVEVPNCRYVEIEAA